MLPESEIEYYLSEGCGIFAAALAKHFPESTILILCDTTGEQWSEAFPHEATHVCLRVEETLIDARGIRTLSEILDEFGINDDQLLKLPVSPVAFQREYMGNDDQHPLYGEKNDVLEALKEISGSGFIAQVKDALEVKTRPPANELGPG